MGNRGTMYSFSKVLKSAINGAVLNRLKIIRGLGPPISPSGHQGQGP